MSIMPIFLGDITYNPLQGPAPKHGPARADCATAHGPTVQTGPVRYRHFCFNPPLACGGVEPGCFRGSRIRFGLAIISFIASQNPVGEPPQERLDTTPLAAWKGGIRSPSPRCRKAVTSAPESAHSIAYIRRRRRRR